MSSKAKRGSVKKRLGLVAFYVAVIINGAIMVFPIFWIVLTSFKTQLQAFSEIPIYLFWPRLDNYIAAISRKNLLFFLKNSFVIAFSTTVLTSFIGSLAAYGFTRFKFRGRVPGAFGLLVIRMFPPFCFVLPLFLAAQILKLVDTHLMMVLSYTTFALPFIVWLMISFFKEVPTELDDAAMIDGCSRPGVFARVVLPLVAPGLAATAILTFVYCWNEFLFALILTRVNAKTAPVIVSEFIGYRGLEWGPMTAVGTLITAPVLVIAVIMQKYLIRGLTMGAVKG